MSLHTQTHGFLSSSTISILGTLISIWCNYCSITENAMIMCVRLFGFLVITAGSQFWKLQLNIQENNQEFMMCRNQKYSDSMYYYSECGRKIIHKRLQYFVFLCMNILTWRSLILYQDIYSTCSSTAWYSITVTLFKSVHGNASVWCSSTWV